MARAERRTHKRIPAKYEISYIHDGDYLISSSKDISIDGMFIHTKKILPVGHHTTLNFSIEELRDISVEAKVAWVNESSNTLDYGMGIQFVNPPDVLQETILKIINRVAVIENVKMT